MINAKRTKYFILLHNINQLWSYASEQSKEAHILVLLMILKKVHYFFIEIKVGLTEMSFPQFKRNLIDKDSFTKAINAESENFNILFEDFTQEMNTYVSTNASHYHTLKSELEKFEFNKENFKKYLLSFSDTIRKQNSCDKLFIERYVCNILDSRLVDELYDFFGTITTSIENHRYIEIMQKLNVEELGLLNKEKLATLVN